MIGLGSIKSGPILEHPLTERNLQREIRPVYQKVRKVRGKRGWLVRVLGKRFAPDPTPEGLGHHAVQVGDYAYELHTDEANQKYLIVQRLTGEQIWDSTVRHEIVGYTDMSDEDIQIMCTLTRGGARCQNMMLIAYAAIKVQSWMRSRVGGRYHVKHNNCQHFTNELMRRVIASSGHRDCEAASLSSGTTFCEKSSLKSDLEKDDVRISAVSVSSEKI